jgi:hypothetical protein
MSRTLTRDARVALQIAARLALANHDYQTAARLLARLNPHR